MRIYDIISKKRDKQKLSKAEIDFFVEKYSKGEIPDYQAAALLMAIYINKMDKEETVYLTEAMMNSGDVIDLSDIGGIKVDKHSTGGVGDKTTIALAPLVAACGAPVAKMSGRGLGHTGGTLDKLEAIPGFSIEMDSKKFVDSVNEHKIAVCGQTASIAVADKKMYALRDVTATVDNISLIAASIMCKKLASGANAILLDVKTGDGAFMKTLDDSFELAKAMVDIGCGMNRETIGMITDMDEPLGFAVGNSLEVIEAIETLKGNGPKDFVLLCETLGSYMLVLAKVAKDFDEGLSMIRDAINSGKALEKLRVFIENQGGNKNVVDDYTLLPLSLIHISHHSITVLKEIVNVSVNIPICTYNEEQLCYIKEQLRNNKLELKHNIVYINNENSKADLEYFELKVRSMGRNFDQDKEFFEAASTAAYYLAEVCDDSRRENHK